LLSPLSCPLNPQLVEADGRKIYINVMYINAKYKRINILVSLT